MKILILNGPNINLLGQREPHIYGEESYADLIRHIENEGNLLGIHVEIRQSNHEGALIDYIQGAEGHFDGLIFNPGAYGHTSIALLDAIQSISIPCIEVHLTNTQKREAFRHHSYTAMGAVGVISGFGPHGYALALAGICRLLKDKI